MSDLTSDVSQQPCPACGTLVSVAQEEPLARVTCPSCGEQLRVERAFDNFLLVETLGVGGMGAVYKAQDTRLDRFVALKLLRKELSADPEEAARLEQEARVTASVNHPNVVQVYSSGSAHGQIYLVMEMVNHGSLDDLMAQHPRVPEAQVLATGIQVARGLQAAHERGLIHRDVKPANILFSDAQTAKIGDFGLAVSAGQKAEARNEIWGTPYYVAPERLNNEPEDFRSDIYSLGATLFHALAGRPPMEGETTSAAALRQLKSHPPDLRKIAPDVSADTARIVNRMLAPKPEHRFATYGHLIDQLQRAYRALPRDGGPARSGSRWLQIAVAAVLLAAVAGAGTYWLPHRQSSAVPETPAAPQPTDKVSAESAAALQRRYDDARRQIIDGKYDAAATTLTKLAGDAANQQPLLNQVRLHRGLALLLGGKATPARTVFQELERSANFSSEKADAGQVRFFTETARVLAAAGPARASSTSGLDGKTADAFAMFLFAVKNWQLGEDGEAVPLFERFLSSEPGGNLVWVNDYKPLARKFLADHAVFAEWKKEPQRAGSSAEAVAGLAKLRALRGKLQMSGALAEALKADEQRLTAEIAQRQKAEKETQLAGNKKLLEQESVAWNAALAEAQKRVAAYDFAGALAVIEGAAVTETSLREAQAAEQKRMRWLIDWKARLTTDLRSGRYTAPVTDLPNVEYQGVASASDSEITLRIPGGRGSAPVKWTALSAKTLLAMSAAFIAANPTEAADRQWLAAAFAYATGQADAGRVLAEAAAAAKPEYRTEMKLLSR